MSGGDILVNWNDIDDGKVITSWKGPVFNIKYIYEHSKAGQTFPHNGGDIFNNFDTVKMTCENNPLCYWDSANYSLLHEAHLTPIYQIIANAMHTVHDGLSNWDIHYQLIRPLFSFIDSLFDFL